MPTEVPAITPKDCVAITRLKPGMVVMLRNGDLRTISHSETTSDLGRGPFPMWRVVFVDNTDIYYWEYGGIDYTRYNPRDIVKIIKGLPMAKLDRGGFLKIGKGEPK